MPTGASMGDTVRDSQELVESTSVATPIGQATEAVGV